MGHIFITEFSEGCGTMEISYTNVICASCLHSLLRYFDPIPVITTEGQNILLRQFQKLKESKEAKDKEKVGLDMSTLKGLRIADSGLYHIYSLDISPYHHRLE